MLGRRSQFAARPIGESDQNRLLEQADAPDPCQISIPKPAFRDIFRPLNCRMFGDSSPTECAG